MPNEALARPRFFVVTNRPRMAALAMFGTWPPPHWAQMVSSPAVLAGVTETDRCFGMFYGDGGELETLWNALKRRHEFPGLSNEDFERMKAWRLKHARPGVIPAKLDLGRIADAAKAPLFALRDDENHVGARVVQVRAREAL